jgi:hypothetical protein
VARLTGQCYPETAQGNQIDIKTLCAMTVFFRVNSLFLQEKISFIVFFEKNIAFFGEKTGET